jgi:hypothetical protein
MHFLQSFLYKVISVLIIIPIFADLISFIMICLLGYGNHFEGSWMTSNIDWFAFISIFATVSILLLKDFRHVLESYDGFFKYLTNIIGYVWMFIGFGAAYHLFDKSFSPGLIKVMEDNNQFALYLLYHSFNGYLLVNAAKSKD